MPKVVVHLSNEDASPGEAERLAELIRKADARSIAVGDQFTAEDGAVYRIVRVDQRLAGQEAP